MLFVIYFLPLVPEMRRRGVVSQRTIDERHTG